MISSTFLHASKSRKKAPRLTKRTRKSTQVCKTRTCAWTCDGWPNGFASRLASSHRLQKVVNSTHIQMTRDQLVSTCIGWPNGEKFASTYVRIWARPKSTQVGVQTTRKWKAKSKTCVDLRVRWPGLYIYFLVHCSSGALHDFFFEGLDKLLCLSLTNRELQRYWKTTNWNNMYKIVEHATNMVCDRNFNNILVIILHFIIGSFICLFSSEDKQ